MIFRGVFFLSIYDEESGGSNYINAVYVNVSMSTLTTICSPFWM